MLIRNVIAPRPPSRSRSNAGTIKAARTPILDKNFTESFV
jgi:hypothetical protein